MRRALVFLNILLSLVLVFIIVRMNRNDSVEAIIKISLKGQVRNATTYFVRESMTVQSLIALAGGYKYNAKRIDITNMKLSNNSVINVEQKYKLKK